ncbi:MAG TPA: ABC-F family ATP-binding cassette domain-containing protein [Polyangia bacterium]|nr:ABC-F family ATP-binding cassette domain-containing protein [Polyangia bacterium]
MAILLSVQGLEAGFGARPLFAGVSFTIEAGERIGLIGPNGAGKSTLLRILAGATAPDDGQVSRQRGLRVGHLEQVPRFRPEATVEELVREAAEGATGPGGEDWNRAGEVELLMSKLALSGRGRGAGVSPSSVVDTLSGGWKKRVALARELARRPDLLLLDEPTNHLDVESIEWLEELLAASPFATVTVTHDRLFLQRVATRILELDRRNAGGLLSVAGDYAAYLRVKQETMHAQERREVVLRNTLRRETEWLQRGAQARSTKQQARIQRASVLAGEVTELGTRNRQRTVALDFEAQERRPRRLIEARGVGKSYDGRVIFRDVDVQLVPGVRLGLLGANGCGKSTLIRVLLGEDPPSAGTITRADDLQISYFAQSRDALDPEVTVANTVCPDGDFVSFRGARVHVRGYLERFLFTAEQADLQVGKLSGGEQSRLLLAALMLQPAQVLVLDEPTNDLDLATLTVLEESLTDFPGAVLLVSHDRYFLDQVATTILAFVEVDQDEGVGDEQGGLPAGAGAGVVRFASLAQWEAWRAGHRVRVAQRNAAARAEPGAGAAAAPAGGKRRLGYLDQREYDAIEATLSAAEAALQAAVSESERPEIGADAARLVEVLGQIEQRRAEVDRLYARWAELEAKREGPA